MDWILIGLLGVLALNITLIIIVLATLPHYGDERKNLIKLKSQSFMFSVVILLLIYEICKSIYTTFWTDGTYGGINPYSHLTGISLVYLITLLIYRKKYGA